MFDTPFNKVFFSRIHRDGYAARKADAETGHRDQHNQADNAQYFFKFFHNTKQVGAMTDKPYKAILKMIWLRRKAAFKIGALS